MTAPPHDPAPPYDPNRCSLYFLRETLAVDEADLHVIAAMFGHEVIDGHLTNDQAADLREWLDVDYSRSTPGWYEPRQSDVDDLGLGGPHL